MDLPSILVGSIVGGVVGFVVNHFGGSSKEHWDERARIANHKREVARKVLDICTLDINRFSMGRPTIKQISMFNKTVTDLMAIDKKLGEKLKISTDSLKKGGMLLISSELIYRDDLIAWANKIRVGGVNNGKLNI